MAIYLNDKETPPVTSKTMSADVPTLRIDCANTRAPIAYSSLVARVTNAFLPINIDNLKE